MKKLLALSVLLGAASCLFAGKLTDTMNQDPAKVEPTCLSFSLPSGDTDMNIKFPFTIDHLEGAFLTGSKTLKIERIRVVDSIPCIKEYRLDDPTATGGIVTDGTTYQEVSDAFYTPLVTNGTQYVLDVNRVRAEAYNEANIAYSKLLTFYTGSVTSSGLSGSSAYVFYSFPSNALYVYETRDRPDLWAYLGRPGRFDYVNLFEASGGVQVAVPAIVNNDTHSTNQVRYLNSRKKYSSTVFYGVTMPTYLTVSTNGLTAPISFTPGHTATNFAVWATCPMTNVATLVDATVGTSFSTNFNKDAVLLPKDVIRVSGTAMPTGYIIGIGSK